MEYEYPFNRPQITGKELEYIKQAIDSRQLGYNGPFTRKCHEWLVEQTGCQAAILTHSCTGALEIAALLLDLEPGDEVIMPSFAYPTTASAFALRGAVPVFVDIRPDTLNIDENLIESAITEKTRAIAVIHYAGIACAMEALKNIAERHNLTLIEDAAHCILAEYQRKPLGTFGALAAFSFHETKNVVSGTGGALLINDEKYIARAWIIAEKGTNRRRFQKGEVEKYTWVDLGSSYMPSEITAAFLWGQLECGEALTRKRVDLWPAYHRALEPLENKGYLKRPIIPEDYRHNGHLYFILLPTADDRDALEQRLQTAGMRAVTHFEPLHQSTAGRRFGRASGDLPHTERVSSTILRLPMWVNVEEAHVIVEKLKEFLG